MLPYGGPKPAGRKQTEEEKEEKRMNYEIRKNEQYGSYEVYFNEIPQKTTREALKALKMRWNGVKKCWYGFKTEDEIKNAIAGNVVKAEPKEVINEYGVKVGDVFHMSWGYDQTNNDFFQVVEVTAKKARVVEVSPSYGTNWATGMAEDRTLTYKEGEMLPRLERSFWIKDNEKGDLKTIKDYSQNKEHPEIVIESGRYWASRCSSGTTFYESWYA